jgi:P pilus assembly chaperone PapD
MRVSMLSCLATTLILLGTAPVPAADLSFSVDPMTTEITAQAGAELTGVIQVKCEEPAASQATPAAHLPRAPLRLRVYPMDWTLDRQGGPQFLKPGTTPGSCSNWLQVNPVELAVPAGEAQSVRYTIRVPEGVQGTFRTILMFETAPEPAAAGPRVMAFNGRIGSTLYVQVGPQAKRARITRFSVTPEKSFVTVENTGTSHIRLQGTLQFQDASGQMVQQVPLPGGVVLPGESNVREICIDTPRLPRKSAYTVTVLLDYGGEVVLGARAHVTTP